MDKTGLLTMLGCIVLLLSTCALTPVAMNGAEFMNKKSKCWFGLPECKKEEK